MSDSKLDYPSAPRRTGKNFRPHAVADSKLDLPGTLFEFQQLDKSSGTPVGIRPFRKKESAEAIFDSNGEARCNFGAPAIGWSWNIERMVVVGEGTARVYVGGEQVSRIVDLTASGSGDVADESSPIYVEDGELVVVVFTGGVTGDLATANAQIQYVPGD